MVDSGRQIRKVGGRVGAEIRTDVHVSVQLGTLIVVMKGVVVSGKGRLGKAIRLHCALETIETQLGAPHKNQGYKP
jgi:hypothetical protein